MITSLQHKNSFALVVALVLSILSGVSVAQGQTTSFTYQGRLTDGGTAANGNYDLQFVLFDSLSGGAQIGSTQTLNTVAVSNGVFTVSLDFGASAFNGANRFLEISARPSSGGSFTLLSPRQQITSTPYAVRSLNATTAETVTVNGTPAFGISGAGNNPNSNTFAGVGAGAVTTPTANDFGAYNSFFGNKAGQANTGGSYNSFFGFAAGFSTTTGIYNSFFGTGAGTSNTTGFSNSFFGGEAGLSQTTGRENSFFGRDSGFSNTSGNFNSFFGKASGVSNTTGTQNTAIGYQTDVGLTLTNATAIGANARAGASNSLVLGSINGINSATVDTNVGIGTTAPTAKLSVIATGDGARVLLLGTERAWVFKQFGTSAASALELTGDDPNNNNKNFVINTQGNVGVGTQGPLDRLHVFGDIRVGITGTNGCLKNNNGGTIVGTCSSDVRFKRDLVPFGPTLQKLTRLQPKYFFWRTMEFPEKNFGAAREAGLIGQEVEQVMPELVSEDTAGYKLVDYSKLPLMLLQAVKEQQAIIEHQQAQLERQDKQIDALKKLVCAINPMASVCK